MKILCGATRSTSDAIASEEGITSFGELQATMDWKKMNLHGASRISRVCGEYDVFAPKVPHGGRFKLKVMEQSDGMFFARMNVCLKDPEGSPDWLGGFGKSEVEAIEKLLKWFMDELAKRESCTPDDFEWSDPLDF